MTWVGVSKILCFFLSKFVLCFCHWQCFANSTSKHKAQKRGEKQYVNQPQNLTHIQKKSCKYSIIKTKTAKKPQNCQILIIQKVLEYCDGGSLFEGILQEKVFSECDASNIIRQTCEGLAYMHEMGYCHGDLKPENIMFQTNTKKYINIKIIDFGLSKDITEGLCVTPRGTEIYAAPEVLENKPYGVKSDCWSLGVLMYVLLCGFAPFRNENNDKKSLHSKIINVEYGFPSPYWDLISETAKELITRVLIYSPQIR